MKYFLDTEFIEDGKTIDLISIAIISEDNRHLYLGNAECDFSKASNWVKENVLIPMGFEFYNSLIMRPIDPSFWLPKEEITRKILEFCSPSESPIFWGYYCDYDWVVFCQLFGTMMDLPKGYPMYCRDLQQEIDQALPFLKGRIPKQSESTLHNALEDVIWIKQTYDLIFED